ncbi:MAG: PAS domain-containing sensor histidine kinase [Bacteroidetes bacterium]|nr:PAS domain-containing sensor histidine kinase [Bacteroidota bacterium]
MLKEIEMLDALFKHATEGIIVSDTKGKIIMINPIAEKLFGFSKDELLGEKIELLIPARFSHNHVKKREGYAKTSPSRAMGIGMDLFAMRKDGSEFPVEISLSNFKTSAGDFIMSFIVDITERKKHEVELKNAHEEIKNLNIELENRVEERTEELARAINRLAESKQEVMRALEKEKELNVLKSRFVTTASHEFRTPLATILSSVSLISKYNLTQEEEKRLKHISRIKSAVNNLTEILNDFLSLSKLEEGVIRNNPQEINISDFAKDVTEEMKAMLKDGQSIVYKHSGNVKIKLDKQLLKNVLINLLSNAIKYSLEDKAIEFYTNNEKQGYVQISIKDNGIGIPEEDQPLLFERFFRAQNAGNIQGTGLGLNIVNKYLELMEGEISFVSKINVGTTFNIIIPTLNN